MQCNRWALGVVVGLLGSFAQGQVPETVPPVKLPPAATGKEIPGAAELIEHSEPFIARYAYCNAMQMYQSRRAAWAPIYRDAGASDADLDAYSGDLVTYIKEFCGDGRPPKYWQDALARVEAFDERVDRAMAASLGIEVGDATLLRISRLLAQLEQLRERCLGGGQAALGEDRVSAFGSLLPATSQPPGLALERSSGTAPIGKCGPDGSSGGGGLGGPGLDRATLSACVAAALDQSSSCDSPIGDAPSGDPTETHDFGGHCMSGSSGAEHCSSAVRHVYDNGAYTDVARTTDTIKSRDGRTHVLVTERRRTIGSNNEVVSDYTRTYTDGHITGVDGTGDEAGDVQRMIREISAPSSALPVVPHGYHAVITELSSPTSKDVIRTRRVERGAGIHGGGASRPRDCASVNPGSSTALGFARTGSSGEDGGSPVHAGRLDPWDLVGQCVCNSLGRLGPGLAADSGFRCAPDENARRLDCLLNPSGPADGIRPECVGYLHDDNPGRDTRTTLAEWCGRIIQCPPGAALATLSDSGGAACSCGTGLATPAGSRGGTPAGGMCARVYCAGGAGAVGEDLYRQCCGAPGDLPIKVDPSSGAPVPRPPDPKEDPKEKSPKSP